MDAFARSGDTVGPQANEKRPLTTEDVERCLRRSGPFPGTQPVGVPDAGLNVVVELEHSGRCRSSLSKS